MIILRIWRYRASDTTNLDSTRARLCVGTTAPSMRVGGGEKSLVYRSEAPLQSEIREEDSD